MAMDVLCVLVFALVGRASHDEGLTVAGVLLVAWPFLAGLAVGWGAARRLRHGWPIKPGAAILVWAGALVVGMVLRAATGAGTALSFVLVAAFTLFAALVGWRSLLEIGRFATGGLSRWSEQNAREAQRSRQQR